MKQEGQRLVQAGSMDHFIDASFELALQRSMQPSRTILQQILVSRLFLLDRVAVEKDIRPKAEIEVVPGKVGDESCVLIQVFQERLAIVMIAKQVVNLALRVLARQTLQPVKGRLDRVFQGRQSRPGKERYRRLVPIQPTAALPYGSLRHSAVLRTAGRISADRRRS